MAKKEPIKKEVEEITNIYTLVGEKANLRAKPFQLVRDWNDDVAERCRNNFPYLVEAKCIGAFGAVLVLKGVAIAVCSTTGRVYNHLDHLLDAFKFKKGVDGVFIGTLFCMEGELFCRDKMITAISPFRRRGITEPQRRALQTVGFMVNDYISIKDLISGVSAYGLLDRTQARDNLMEKSINKSKVLFVAQGSLEGSLKAIESLRRKAIKEGFDGVIIKDRAAKYKAGHKLFHSLQLTDDINAEKESAGKPEEGKKDKEPKKDKKDKKDKEPKKDKKDKKDKEPKKDKKDKEPKKDKKDKKDKEPKKDKKGEGTEDSTGNKKDKKDKKGKKGKKGKKE